MKTAQVTTVAFTLDKMARGWLRHLVNEGLEVHTVSAPSETLVAIRDREGITATHVVNMSRRMAPIQDLKALAALIRLFHRERYDVIHASTPKAGLLAMLAGTVVRTPVLIYTVRGLPLETATGWRWVVQWLAEWIACRLSHRVIAVSPSLKKRIAELRLARSGRVIVIGRGSSNGVDAQRFTRRVPPAEATLRANLGILPEAVVVGFIGRLVADKGVGDLAEAWQSVRTAYPECHLLVVGPLLKDEEPLPRATLDLLENDERVHLVGYAPDPIDCYEAMDLLVLPTYREGFPNVILEAAAMSVAAVGTTATGCIDAIVDNTTGLLVAPRDPPALAAAIMQLVDDETSRTACGQAARDRVIRDFQREDIWSGILGLYAETLNQSRHSRKNRDDVNLP